MPPTYVLNAGPRASLNKIWLFNRHNVARAPHNDFNIIGESHAGISDPSPSESLETKATKKPSRGRDVKVWEIAGRDGCAKAETDPKMDNSA